MGEIRVKNGKLAIAEIIRREKLIRPVSNRNLSLTSPPTNRQINSETSRTYVHNVQCFYMKDFAMHFSHSVNAL